MDKIQYDNYVNILHTELIPALGCTEPIALAYAAAKARDVLGTFPDHMKLCCSGNIIKNVKGVTVPNSGGLKGIDVAAALGVTGGNADNALEVLEGVTDADREKAVSLISQGFCDCSLKEGVANLYIEARAEKGEEYAEVTIINTHTNITKIVKNGQVLEEHPADTTVENKLDKSKLNVHDIIEFANTVNLEDVREVLERQINCNSAISDEGLKNPWGAQVGRTLLETYGDNIKIRAKARAAAGSDARMSGCALPVVINSGSGNQGMTASLPVIEYAKELQIGEEKLLRALVVSNLIALEQKKYIGSLSAYCGAVCAGCGAGAAITYMCGGTMQEIEDTIVNTIANVGGIVCDGAKPSCAAKIAASVDAAILGHHMAMKKRAFSCGEGLVQKDADSTIKALGYVGRVGMKQTDVEILNIMIGKTDLEQH